MASRAWLETERQGAGRRYWFRTSAEAIAFWHRKREAGWPAVMDTECSTTVWVAFGKKVTPAVRAQMDGRDG